jgi:hypothetical protein
MPSTLPANAAGSDLTGVSPDQGINTPEAIPAPPEEAPAIKQTPPPQNTAGLQTPDAKAIGRARNIFNPAIDRTPKVQPDIMLENFLQQNHGSALKSLMQLQSFEKTAVEQFGADSDEAKQYEGQITDLAQKIVNDAGVRMNNYKTMAAKANSPDRAALFDNLLAQLKSLTPEEMPEAPAYASADAIPSAPPVDTPVASVGGDLTGVNDEGNTNTPEAPVTPLENAPGEAQAEPETTPEPATVEAPQQKKVVVSGSVPSSELSTDQLVQRVKAMGKRMQDSYGLFVRERNLKPEIDMKQFVKIWDSVGANPYNKAEPREFTPTHLDTLLNKQVQITDDGKAYNMLWEDGHTGTDPKQFFNSERYKPLSEDASTEAEATPVAAKEPAAQTEAPTETEATPVPPEPVQPPAEEVAATAEPPKTSSYKVGDYVTWRYENKTHEGFVKSIEDGSAYVEGESLTHQGGKVSLDTPGLEKIEPPDHNEGKEQRQLFPYEQSKTPKSVANVLFTGGRMISGDINGRPFASDTYAMVPVTPADMTAIQSKTREIQDYGNKIGGVIPKNASLDIGNPIGKDFSEGTDVVVFGAKYENGKPVVLNQRYYDYFRSKNLTLKVDPKDSHAPAVAYDKDGDIQGVVMPVNIKDDRAYSPANDKTVTLGHVEQLALRDYSSGKDFAKAIKKSTDWPSVKKMLASYNVTPEQFYETAAHPAVQSLSPENRDIPLPPGVGATSWKPGDPMVDTSPMNLRLLKNDKQTSRDWRQEVTGKLNAQVDRGIQVGDAIKELLKPTKDNPAGEEEIAYIIRDTKGDTDLMKKLIALPDERLDELMPDKSKLTYRQGLEQAVKGLTGQGIEGEALADQLYHEIQDRSVELGTIGRGDPDFQGIEDYVNRIYQELKPQDYLKTETNRRGLGTYTSHGQARVWPTVFHAHLGLDENLEPALDDDGNPAQTRTPATMKLSKLAKILNEEMAKVNTNMEFQDASHDLGLGKWTTGSVPDGWAQTGLEKKAAIGGTGGITPDLIDKYLAARRLDPAKMTTNEKISEVDKLGENIPNSVRLAIQDIKDDIAGKVDKNGLYPSVITHKFIMPKGIADGMAAVLEPNFIKKVDALRGLQKYQGIVKTVDLSYSVFHHATMLAQMLYQSKGGLDLLMNYGRIKDMMDKGTFNQAEQDFVRHTGMTDALQENMDAMRKLTSGDDLLSKMANVPGIKQFLQGAEASRNLLFGKMQRWLKVMDYNNKSMKWISAHPDATDDDLVSAKRGIAREINNAYGGLNWQALGVTPSVQSLLRMTLLAPDWTVSNYALFVDAAGNWKGPENATAGGAARSHIATALIAGGILTEGLNYVLTGHYTDKNPKGHETEVEISPGVYVSLFRGGIGDGLKLVSNWTRYGVGEGSGLFIQGKLSPLMRMAVGILSNTDQLGRKIAASTKTFGQNTASVATFLADSAAPVPFGGSELSQYLFANKGPVAGIEQYDQTGKLPNQQTTPEGMAAVGSGLGTYAPPPNKGSVFDVPAAENQGNLIQAAEDDFNPDQSGMGQLKTDMSNENKAKLADDKNLEEALGQAVESNDNAAIPGIFQKYGIPTTRQKALLNGVKNKLDKRYVADYPYNYDVSQSLGSFYNNLDAMQTAAANQDTTGFNSALMTYFTRQGKSLTAARNMLTKVDGNQKLSASEKSKLEQNYQSLMLKIADASNRHYDEWAATQQGGI